MKTILFSFSKLIFMPTEEKQGRIWPCFSSQSVKEPGVLFRQNTGNFRKLGKRRPKSRKNRSCPSSNLPAFSDSWQHTSASPNLSRGPDLGGVYNAWRVSLSHRQRRAPRSLSACCTGLCLCPFSAAALQCPDIPARCASSSASGLFRLPHRQTCTGNF